MNKIIMVTSILGFIIFHNAFAEHDRNNGGDICEKRIDEISDDIDSWILNNGPQGLVLPESLPLETYKSTMRDAIAKTNISCVNNIIKIGNSEKTCQNYVDENGESKIECNIERFMNKTSESDQYVLIHHEYAGISGFEVNSGANSDYEISKQITGFLEDQKIKRLVIKPTKVNSKPQECGSGLVIDASTFAIGDNIPDPLMPPYTNETYIVNRYDSNNPKIMQLFVDAYVKKYKKDPSKWEYVYTEGKNANSFSGTIVFGSKIKFNTIEETNKDLQCVINDLNNIVEEAERRSMGNVIEFNFTSREQKLSYFAGFDAPRIFDVESSSIVNDVKRGYYWLLKLKPIEYKYINGHQVITYKRD